MRVRIDPYDLLFNEEKARTGNELLGRIATRLDERVPEGEPDEREIAVTEKATDIDVSWFSFTLFNDGPGNVFVGWNNKLFPTVPIKKGESYTVDGIKRGGIQLVRVKCSKGETASVRIKALR